MRGLRPIVGLALVLVIASSTWTPVLASSSSLPLPPAESRLRDDPFIRQEPGHVGVVKKVVPGLVGAVLGGYLGGSFGFVGRLVGGLAGWYVGNQVGKLLFPKRWYDDYEHYPWYYRQQYRSSAGGSTLMGYGVPTYAPLAPVLDERLSAIHKEWEQALRSLQDTMRGSDDAAKKAAQSKFDDVDKRYKAARREVYGQ